MPRQTPKDRLSIRINSELEKFLREKSEELGRGYSSFVEEVITTGAAVYGYEPKIPGDFHRLAEVIATMVMDRIEKKGSSGKSQV